MLFAELWVGVWVKQKRIAKYRFTQSAALSQVPLCDSLMKYTICHAEVYVLSVNMLKNLWNAIEAKLYPLI